jgi:uncharacterized membrane protein YfcA
VWAASLRSSAPMWSCPGPRPGPVRQRKVLRRACGHFHAVPRQQRRVLAFLGALAAGAYGGYFSACQGVVLIGVLGTVRRTWNLQKVNAAKNVLATAALTTAVALFASIGHVAWAAAVLLAAGSMVGGHAGAWAGRHLPSPVLRGVVVTVGLAAITRIVI